MTNCNSRHIKVRNHEYDPCINCGEVHSGWSATDMYWDYDTPELNNQVYFRTGVIQFGERIVITKK